MHILLTGGTGLMGRRLCQTWTAQGHQVSVWSRQPERVPEQCGLSVRGVGRLEALDDQPLGAVVNLAGAPIADRPWTKRRKAVLWESRIALTEQLVTWLGSRQQRPDVLISGSAIGWYGDGGDRLLDEYSPPADVDFATRLCQTWEETAQRAEALGIRVVRVRTGLVLAREGGFLQKMVPPFRLGLGGPLGDGRQWMPWIHMEDQIGLIDFLLQQPETSGPYNACAPQPVRNADFARALGRALHRPAVIPLPAFVLKAAGEMSVLLLGGQNARPTRLQEAGYRFRFTDLDAALGDVLGNL